MKRIPKILKSMLNGGNSFKAIKSWVAPVIRNTVGIINWAKSELDELDNKTKKIHVSKPRFTPQSDVCQERSAAEN